MHAREHSAYRPVPALIEFAMRLDVSLAALVREAGIDPVQAMEPGWEISYELDIALWDAAVRLSGDPDLGLHLAEWVCTDPEHQFDVLAYAVRSCATLAEHYRCASRYARLSHPLLLLGLELDDAQTGRLVHMRSDGGRPPRQPAECMLAVAILQGRRAVGDDLVPREVRFSAPAPERTSEQERLFRAPVRYHCERDELVFERADLARPQRHAEPRLQRVLERQLADLLAALPQDSSMSSQVKRCLADRLPGDGLNDDLTVGAIATALHMSPRSLQRRLSDEHTTFARLLAEVRRDMALGHLRDPRRSIGEVAFLLGFAEVSGFHRAFKRWTGKTPAEYQRAVQRE